MGRGGRWPRMCVMGPFKDHFSSGSERYTKYRPSYPRALFAHLASLAPSHGCAWDCATGNGQAAVGLASFFNEVRATDASRQQIAVAVEHPRVRYAVAPAESSGLAPGSTDLISIAQALHWLPLEAFYAEVRRVARSEAVVAAWCYEIAAIETEVDAIVAHLYHDIVGEFWPPERKSIEQRYETIPFPFDPLPVPGLRMEAHWTLPEWLGYLGTWSAVRRYTERHDRDPLALIEDDLSTAWGDPAMRRVVRWPLHVRLGRL